MEEQIEAVRRMQDYIEEHLYENITPADLAGAALYSPWHSYRLFIKWINSTPADYIRRMRLSRSALRLRSEKMKIIHAALECGFSSVDGYQRAFFREFGCNPHEYARSPVPIYLFTPFKILPPKNRKGQNMNSVQIKSVFITVTEKPERKAIIMRGIKATDYCGYCEEVGCDVWGLLVSMKSISGEPTGMWLPEKYITPGTSKYVQGVEVATDYDGVIPENFDVIDLPAAKYLMFQSEPFQEEDYEEAIGQLWEAIEKYDPSVIGYSWDHDNPRYQPEPIGTRGYIEFVAVK